MNQMFLGLWNVYEHPRDKLEWVDRLAVVGVVSGFGLIDEEAGFRMITKSGQIHWRALQLCGVITYGERRVQTSSLRALRASHTPHKSCSREETVGGPRPRKVGVLRISRTQGHSQIVRFIDHGDNEGLKVAPATYPP